VDYASVFLFAVAVALFLIALAGLPARHRPVDAWRLARIERKLDRVLRHLGIEEERQDDADVRALVREGAKIHAIKVYRQRHGVGLKEAKDAVDAIWVEENGPRQ
jgi:trimethylamine:corrinoid methyltransferase-like protein